MSEMAEAEALLRSLLWHFYFEKSKNEGKCKTCKKVLQCKGGNTVGLSRHLKATHKKKWAEFEVAVAKRDERAKKGPNSSKSMPPPKRRKEDFLRNHEGEDVLLLLVKNSTNPL